jgi:ATP-dependent exoDNAse (exonuclease V) beta subunit
MTEAKVLSDRAARDRAESELGTSFVVEAAAGSGKTTLLVRRLVALLLEKGVLLRRILATTFTDRAAGEITLRLREELETRRGTGSPAQREAAERALHQMEDARIGTLHGLAGELLREVPLLSGIDPEFTVLGADEARALRERVIREHLGELLASPPEGLRRWLRRPRKWDDPGPIHRLTQALEELTEQRDLSTPWRRPEGFEQRAAIDRLTFDLEALLGRAAAAKVPAGDHLGQSLAGLRALHAAWTQTERHASRDHDAIEAAIAAMTRKELEALEKAGRVVSWSDKAAYAELKAARDAWLEQRSRFRADADADLAALVRAELWPAIERYESLKRKQGVLDFHDLLAVLLRTLRTQPEARRFFSERIEHVVVDEVQDSDPMQLDLIALLAAADPDVDDPQRAVPAAGKLFVVGDPKQAIYGWRRSSVDGYLRFRDRMIRGGVVPLTLDATFRCPPSIARVVDRALAGAFVAGPFQPAYVPLQPVREERGQPHVIALPVPDPYGYRGVYTQKVNDQLPELVASFVDHLVRASGFTVEERGAWVPVRARHVALLYRKSVQWGVDRVGPIARALERRGLGHTHVGGRSFHEEEEVAHLRTVLRAIEWPDDELAVYATLRGPLLAHGDAELFGYRSLVGSLSPFRVPRERARLSAADLAIAASLDLLRDLHRKRAQRPIADTLSRFLSASAASISLASADRGDLLLLRVARLVELAVEREARGALSFRRFVEDLEDAAERGDDVPLVAPAELDAVQFLSVHAAKGLEFPIVFLVDPMTSGEGPAKIMDVGRGLYVDRFLGLEPLERRAYEAESAERGAAEGARLLYVAATRARDLLVVPTTGEGPLGGWLTPLEAALRPAEPRRPAPLPGAPELGKRTILRRGDDPPLDEPADEEVAPGLHRVPTPGGEARVAFWDPEPLTRGVPPRPGVRHHGVFAEAKGAQGAEARASHARFLEGRRARIERTAASGARVVLLSDLMLDAQAEAACEVELEELGLGLAASAALPSTRGAQLVHAALEGGLDTARQRTLHRAAELGAPEAEAEAALAIAAALCAHPDLSPIVARLRRAPFVMPVSSRFLVEGTALVSDEVSDLGAFAVAVHAGVEPKEVAALRIRLAATAHGKASGRPVRALLVSPFA